MDALSPLSILLLVSSPHEAAVSVRDDLHALHAAVDDLPYAAEFVACVAESDALLRVLNRYDRPRFRLLHFIGHGAPDGDASALLAFESRLGELRLLDGAALAPVLAPAGQPEFELAVLSACHSERVADALVALGVRHVVAIEADATVYEIAAVRFYEHFYRALFTGASAQAEAAKFRLLPAGADHAAVTIAAAPDAAGARMRSLPSIAGTHFRRPAVGFIGRSAEKLAILRELDAHRGVLIRGVSGIGKSELARESARWLAERGWVDARRCYFAPLAEARSATEVRVAVALAIGVGPDQLPQEGDQANDWLAQQLPRRSLLVLDEAENAVEAGGRAVRDLMERLVQAESRPLLIVTSQKDVGSRALPAYAVQRMRSADAVRMFVQCAGLDGAGLARLDRTHLAEALDFVDRVPRAIELLGAEWRYRRDADFSGLIADLRRHRDRILRDPHYPDEVKSVTLGVQLAYDRLAQRSLDAAALFADLSLFPGGLNEAGAVALYGAAAPRLLHMIEDQSLLERPYPDLFYLPTPFRHFAERQLTGGVAAAKERLGMQALAFYEDWVDSLDRGLQGGGDAMGAVAARYLAELSTIEAWAAWGLAHEAATESRPRAPQLVASLQNIYVMGDLLRHRRALLVDALAAAQRLRDRGGEANVQKALGDLALREDDLGEARVRYAAALAIYPQIGARLEEANVQKALGDLALREADLGEARVRYAAALAIYPQIGDRLGEANVLSALAQVELLEGNRERALHLLGRALDFYQSVNDRYSIAAQLANFGLTLLRQGRREEATPLLHQAADLFAQIDLPQYALQLRRAAGPES
jgi:tetratricopeptide (TPR) repeat protein